MSRQRIEIDRDKFEHLLTIQCTKQDICQHFRCSHDTVEAWCKRTYKKTFSDVTDDFHADGRVSLRRIQYTMAENGNVQMAIHLGKQWLGQSDKSESKVTAQAELNVKRGDITRVIYYDPVTGNPTQETIQGADDDVKAYLRDHDGYCGDSMTFHLPNKDIPPEELEKIQPEQMDDAGISGERTIVSMDGKTRIHLPYDGRDPLPIELVTMRDDGGKTILEDYDDGRGGLKTDLTIEHSNDDGSKTRFNWGNNGRGGHTPRKEAR